MSASHYEQSKPFRLTSAILNNAEVDAGAKSGKWVLFILPLITVLREGKSRSSLLSEFPLVATTDSNLIIDNRVLQEWKL